MLRTRSDEWEVLGEGSGESEPDMSAFDELDEEYEDDEYDDEE